MSEPSIRIHARAYRRGVVFIFSPCIIRVNSFSASLVFYSIFVPTRMRTRLDPSSLRFLPASFWGALPTSSFLKDIRRHHHHQGRTFQSLRSKNHEKLVFSDSSLEKKELNSVRQVTKRIRHHLRFYALVAEASFRPVRAGVPERFSGLRIYSQALLEGAPLEQQRPARPVYKPRH